MILTVKQIKKEARNAFSIIFENQGDRFYPGQYLEFEGKCFSIASSPSEPFLMITTFPSKSKLKRKFLRLQPGDKIESSHPAGTITIDEVDPLVFIAGGIGITPFRSMIKWAYDRKFKTKMTLIYSSSQKKIKTAAKRGSYSNSDNDFIYKKELDTWKKDLPNLTIHYINTNKDGRLNNNKLEPLILNTDPLIPIYYIAGSPSFVDAFEKMLLEIGIDKLNIRTDRYDGY